MSDWKAAATLVRKIAENYRLPYYTISPTYSVCPNDGYLSGEVWKCPRCGAETEVYSRITGYYRPVKNWNAGKTQEFKDRKTYKVEGLVSRPVSDFIKEERKEALDVKPQEGAQEYLLFTTRTCPNCGMIRKMLDNVGFAYRVVDAEEHPDLARRYGIMQAPSLVALNGDNASVFANASNIIRYVNETRAHA